MIIAVLVIFPVILQTVINIIILSIEGQRASNDRNNHKMLHYRSMIILLNQTKFSCIRRSMNCVCIAVSFRSA